MYAENNIKLYRIYVSCIEESLQSLKETALEERNAVFDTIYGILGLFILYFVASLSDWRVIILYVAIRSVFLILNLTCVIVSV